MARRANSSAAQMKQCSKVSGTPTKTASTAAATRSARESLDAIIQRMEKRGDYSPSFLDLRLNAEAQWITAKRTELDTITNYNAAIANYLHATGRILTRNGIRLRRARAERNSRN